MLKTNSIKNKVVLHTLTESLWLVDSCEEETDEYIFLTELTNLEDGLQCIGELSECAENPIDLIAMVRDLGVASDDECCMFLRAYADRLLVEVDRIMDEGEKENHDYLN